MKSIIKMNVNRPIGSPPPSLLEVEKAWESELLELGLLDLGRESELLELGLLDLGRESELLGRLDLNDDPPPGRAEVES